MRRRLYILSGLVLVSLVFSLLAVQSQPFSRLLSRLVKNQLQQALGGEVSIGRIEIHPLQRRLVVRDFALNKKRSDLRRLAFAELSAQLAYSPLALGKVTVSELRLTRPEIFWAEAALAEEKKEKGSASRSLFRRRSLLDFDVRKVQIDQLQTSFHYPSAGVRGEWLFDRIETHREGEEFASTLNGRGRLHFRTGTEELRELTAQARFSKKKVGIRSLRLRGQGLGLELYGAIYPKLGLTFSFQAEPSAFYRISRGQVTMQERLAVSGKLGGSVSASQAQGRLSGLNLKLAGLSVNDLSFDYLLGRQQLQLVNGSFRGPGGPVRFRFTLRKKKQVTFAFHLENEVPNLSLVLPQLGYHRPPLEPQGRLACRLDAEGTVRPLDARLAASCLGRELGLALRDPENGVLLGRYPLGQEKLDCALRWQERGGLTIEKCQMDGPRARLQVSAAMPHRRQVEGKIEATFRALKPSVGRLPSFASFDIAGPFTLSSSGSRWEGEVQGANFAWEELRAPRLAARVKLEQGLLTLSQLTLLFGQGSALAAGQLPLWGRGRWALSANIRDLALPPFMSLRPRLQEKLRLTRGSLNFSGRVEGPAGQPQWSGELRLEQLSSAISGLERGTAMLEGTRSGLTVKNAQFSGEAGQLSLAGHYLNPNSFSLFLHSEGLNLDRLTARRLPPYLRGRLTADARFEQRPAATPLLEGNLRLQEDPAQGGQVLLRAAFAPQGAGEKLDLDLLGERGHGRFYLQLEKPYLLSGELALQQFDPFYLMIRRPRDRRYARGEISGAVRLQLPLAHPAQITASGSLTDVVVRNDKYTLYAPANLAFTLAPGKFSFNPLHLVGERADLVIRPELEGGDLTRIVAEGELDLIYLSYLLQDIPRAEGQIPLRMTIEDPLGAKAAVSGRAEVRDGLIAVRGFPGIFQRISARVQLHDYRLTFESVQSEIGGGRTSGGGTLVFGPGRWLTYDLQGDFQSVRLPASPNLPVTGSGRLYFRGTEPNLELGGEAKLEKAVYTESFDWRTSLGAMFRRGKERQLALNREEENQIKLRLHLDGRSGDIRVRNSFMSGEVRGELSLLGTVEEPVLNGALTAPSGEAWFQNNRFEIQSVSLQMIGEKETRALYTVAAQSQIKDYMVFLNINGVNDDLRVNLTSDPALTPTEIVALLTMGVPSAEAGQVSNAVSDASRNLAISVITGKIQTMVESGSRNLGLIDTFQIVPSYSEDTRTTGLRMVVGKELLPRLDLQYSTDLDNIGTGQEIRLRNRINRNFSILGSFKDNSETTNKDSDLGFDLEVGFEY